MPQDGLKVLTGTAPEVRVDTALTLRLKFNMITAAACDARFGRFDPLVEITDPKEGQETDTLLFILVAACMHPDSGLDADINAIAAKTIEPKDEVERFIPKLTAQFDTYDADAIKDALAQAMDNNKPRPACFCEHRFGAHHLLGTCTDAGCRCIYYHPAKLACLRCKHDVMAHTGEDHQPSECADCECKGFKFIEDEPGKADAPDEPLIPESTGEDTDSSLPDTTSAAASSG